MATQIVTSAPAIVPYRLTVKQVEKMLDVGVFRDGARFELLGGLLVDKMTTHEPHNFAVFQFAEGLRRILPAGWCVREEKSLRLGRRWLPEPDIAVLRRPMVEYRGQWPGPDDIALIGEVADTSYARDRGPKWQRYAAVRIPAYWIVNLPKRQVEVFTEPAGRGKAAEYQSLTTFGADADAEISVVLDGRPLGQIAVQGLLS